MFCCLNAYNRHVTSGRYYGRSEIREGFLFDSQVPINIVSSHLHSLSLIFWVTWLLKANFCLLLFFMDWSVSLGFLARSVPSQIKEGRSHSQHLCCCGAWDILLESLHNWGKWLYRAASTCVCLELCCLHPSQECTFSQGCFHGLGEGASGVVIPFGLLFPWEHLSPFWRKKICVHMGCSL